MHLQGVHFPASYVSLPKCNSRVFVSTHVKTVCASLPGTSEPAEMFQNTSQDVLDITSHRIHGTGIIHLLMFYKRQLSMDR